MEQGNVSLASAPKNAKRYWSTLLSLMSLKDGVLYPQDHVFTSAQLLTLTPNHVVEFFCLKVSQFYIYFFVYILTLFFHVFRYEQIFIFMKKYFVRNRRNTYKTMFFTIVVIILLHLRTRVKNLFC